jgi:predicted component of type VI protein secretion system
MWKPETVLMYVNSRREASSHERDSMRHRNDDQALMRTSEAAGEEHAFARLSAVLDSRDNPYRMLGKIQEIQSDMPASLAEDYIACFQYVQACREVATLIRAYLDHVEWNVPRTASICQL